MERLYILLGYFLVALILLCVIYESMWAWIFAILFLFLYNNLDMNGLFSNKLFNFLLIPTHL